MTTAEKLKQIRIEHGYSLDKMAQLLGYSRTHYSKMPIPIPLPAYTLFAVIPFFAMGLIPWPLL